METSNESGASSVSNGKSSTGLDQNVAGLLCYILGLLTGVIFLLVEKENKFVKFHAWQCVGFTGAVIGLWVVNMVLLFILAFIPIVGWLLSILLWVTLGFGAFIVWVVLMIKAFQGQKYKLPYIGDFAEKQVG